MKFRKDKDFFSVFHAKTGYYARSGLYQGHRETNADPFASSFPEALDVQITGNGFSAALDDGGSIPHMSVSDFESIARQCRGQTYQFVLCGPSDPDQHEAFSDILGICRSNGIVPNITTSGQRLTDTQVMLCAEYCGAVAISWQETPDAQRVIDRLTKAGIHTSLHFVLSRITLPEALQRLSDRTFPRQIRDLVFRLHKPRKSGSDPNVVEGADANLWKLLRLVASEQFPYKIRFEPCFMPALLENPDTIDLLTLDTCDAARWAACITSDLKMIPCRFDQTGHWAVDLRTHSIAEAWQSRQFEDFRAQFLAACPQCAVRNFCLGGCPLYPEIVLCRHRPAGWAQTTPAGYHTDLPACRKVRACHRT